MKKAVFQLEPLTCPSCIRKIETVLKKQPGVDSAKVLFNLDRVKTVFDETRIEPGQLTETLKNLGYEVKSAKTS